MGIRSGISRSFIFIITLITFAAFVSNAIAQETVLDAAPIEATAAAAAAVETVEVVDSPVVVELSDAAAADIAAAEGAPVEIVEEEAAAEAASVDEVVAEDIEVAVDPEPVAEVREADDFVDEPLDDVSTLESSAEDVVEGPIDDVAAFESAEVGEVDPTEVVVDIEAIETYAIPQEPLTTLVLKEGDAFTLTCFALDKANKDFDPLLMWKASPNDNPVIVFVGLSRRPNVPAAINDVVSVIRENHLYHYNFHSASAGLAGEFECDYTGQKDLAYHVIVLEEDSITCPKAGSHNEQSNIEEASCSIIFSGFFPDGFVPQPSLQLVGGGLLASGDLASTESFFSEDNRLNVVANNVYIVRMLNGANFKCVFPLTSASLSISCNSDPLEVLWEPGKNHLSAPASLVKGVPQIVSCHVDDLGNPPTAIELYVEGQPEIKGVQNGTQSILPYTEDRQVRLVEFVCRTSAIDSEIAQQADVFFGPDDVSSLSSDTAVMVEGDRFTWECFPTRANPEPEVEYWLCAHPEDKESCTAIEDHKGLHAIREWQHKYLLCTATNPQTLHKVSSMPHKIDVHHKPRLVASDNIEVEVPVRKGASFELDCEHEANPENIVYVWEKQVFDQEDAHHLRRKRREDLMVYAEDAVTPAAAPAQEEEEEEVAAVDPTVSAAEPVVVSVDGTPGPRVAVDMVLLEKEGEEEEEEEKEEEEEEEVLKKVHQEAPVEVVEENAEEVTASAEEEQPEEVVIASVEEGAEEDAPSDEEATSEPEAEPEAENAVEEEASVGEEAENAETASEEVNIAPFVAEIPEATAEAPEEEEEKEEAEDALPTIGLTTPRPLRPSVDLSGLNSTKFVVASAEAKHFGSYVCKATNSIGDSVVRFLVVVDNSPTKEELEAQRKKEEEEKRKKNAGNGASSMLSGSSFSSSSIIVVVATSVLYKLLH